MSAGAVSAQTKISPDSNDSLQTLDALKKNPVFASKWIDAEFEGRKFTFAVANLLSDSEPYIDLHGWIYNQIFKEWRRIFLIHARNLFAVEIKVDTRTGIVSARSTDNTSTLKGIEVFRFDLRATSDDSAFRK
jgi:hypothetical protein